MTFEDLLQFFLEDEKAFYEKYVSHLSLEEQKQFLQDNPEFAEKGLIELNDLKK